MDINRAELLANRLMGQHGLLIKGWKFQWDNAKRRFGVCKHRLKIIGLSRILTEQTSEGHTIDTILHEIAHAIVGVGHGHNHVWRRMAIEIGCNGNRCGTEKVHIEYKYEGTCPNGHKSGKHRRPKRKYSCGKCSNKYDERYLITYRQVK